MRTSGAIAAVLGLLPFVWAAACVRPSPPAPVAPTTSPSGLAAASTAVWDYHPASPKRLRARLDLGPAVRLFAGDAGERWLVDARAGKAEAASMLADEDLVAIAQPSPGVFSFVGASGTIYKSDSPLGPLSALSRPHPPIFGTAAAGKFILGVRFDGTPVRSADGGATFAPVQGVPAHILDVAIAPDGRAMLLGSPESLWVSKDGGVTFTKLAVEPIGAAFVMLEAGGALVARGFEKSVLWPAQGEPVAQAVTYAIEPPALELLTDVEPGPSARAYASGHAAIVGGRYYEAIKPPNDKGVWQLATGALTGRTRSMPIDGSRECREMLVSGGGRTVAMVCTSRSTRDESVLFPPLRLLMSRDAGATFDTVSTGLVADEEDTHVAVSSQGTLLVTGACKPLDRGICVPGAPMRLVPSAHSKKVRFSITEASKLPPVLGRTGQVKVSPDGNRLYSTATLADGRRAAVLISDDDGESFRGVPIDLPTKPGDAGAGNPALVGLASDSLSIDSNGRLSIVAPTAEGSIWIVLDAQARILSARVLPLEYARVSAIGLRGLAVSSATGDVVESIDGGVTFRKAGRLPKSEGSNDSPAPVVCVEDGCLVGESFTRVGWGQSVGGALEPAPAASAAPTISATPIVCDVQDDVGADVPNAELDIDAFDADRGGVAWSTFTLDRAKASVQVLHGVTSPKPSVETVALLSPTTADGYAVAVRAQAEGLAALRYRFDRTAAGAPKPGSVMRQVEIAWDHQIRGRLLRATIADAGPMRPQDLADQRKGEASIANIALLSVTDDGTFVCPHSSCGDDLRDAMFVDDRGRSRRVRLPELPSVGYGDRPVAARRHFVRAGGKDVFLGVILDGGAVLRARTSEQGISSLDAVSILPTTAQANGFRGTLTWAFQGTTLAGMTFTASHPSHPGFASLLRVDTQQGVAALEDAATQSELGDPPRACSDADRKDAIRSVVPSQVGTRHPVIIHSAGGAVDVLLTDYAILYGRKGSACVSTLDTIQSPGNRANVSALITAGAMESSWFFMPAPSGGLRWRAMRCRYEPGAKVPEQRSPTTPPPSAEVPSARAIPAVPPLVVPAGAPPPPGIPSAVWALLQSGAMSAMPPGLLPPGLLPSGLPVPPPSATPPPRRPPPPARPPASGRVRIRQGP